MNTTKLGGWGPLYQSAFNGSLVGTGTTNIALWAYICSMGRQGTIELNPIIIATIFGISVEEVEKAITFHCSPDPKSRNQEHEGRRLLHDSGFRYIITGWGTYRHQGNGDDNREYMREAKRRERERKREGGLNPPVKYPAPEAPKPTQAAQPPPEPPEDQQQIPIKDLPIEKKYPGHCARLIPRLRTLLNARFGRQKEQRWSYAEEFELVKVASRELPIEEFTAIQDMYAETEAKYIPNTAKGLMSFLQNWASFVEKAAASGFTIIPNKTAHHSDYFIWPWCTRESGGPKPEQFDDTERGKADYASFRNAYDSWVKK